jgi:hypothetical protein
VSESRAIKPQILESKTEDLNTEILPLLVANNCVNLNLLSKEKVDCTEYNGQPRKEDVLITETK